MGNPKLTAAIVDDEDLARQYLRELIDRYDDVEIIAECANGFEAVKTVTEHQPDLLFLDIQMPKLDGFEVLELLPRYVDVIFVTAYDEYALRAFEVHAVDYLLKPFSSDRFDEALAHARRRRLAGESQAARGLMAHTRPPSRRLRRIAVKDGASVHVFPVEKLDYAEAQEDYVALKVGGHTYLKQQTITRLEESLDPSRFLRIHRSYLVNVERILRIEPYAKERKVVVLTTGEQLPLSRSGQSRLKELFDAGA